MPDYRKLKSLDFLYSGINGGFKVTNEPLPFGFLSIDTMEEIGNVTIKDNISSIQKHAEQNSPLTINRSYLAQEIENKTDGVVQYISLNQRISQTFFSKYPYYSQKPITKIFYAVGKRIW